MHRMALPALVAALLLAAGCEDASRDHDTRVLGGASGAASAAGSGPSDALGRALPVPPAPAGVAAQVAPAGEAEALAVWVQEGRVAASVYAPGTGWSPPQRLEDIRGEASDAQLAANAEGKGLAVWRHTVGSIDSLRFSHFTPGAGWSIPDVMPGALPRPQGAPAAIELRMDPAGNAVARWASGFDARELQVARFAEGQGWSRASSEPVAAAPPAR